MNRKIKDWMNGQSDIFLYKIRGNSHYANRVVFWKERNYRKEWLTNGFSFLSCGRIVLKEFRKR